MHCSTAFHIFFMHLGCSILEELTRGKYCNSNTPDPKNATLATFGWYVTNVQAQMLWMQAHSSLGSVDVPTRQRSGGPNPQASSPDQRPKFASQQERRKEFFDRGPSYMLFFNKGSFCTDLFPNTLYDICLHNGHPPYPTPLPKKDPA